jgi:hypothetical protein
VNRRIATLIAAGAVGAFAFAMPGRALPPGVRDTYNKSSDAVVVHCGQNGENTLTIHAPSDLWPPNHKYYTDIHVTYTDASGDDVTLESDGTHDQYDGDTEANGSGNTADDIRANDADNMATVDNSDPQQPVATEKGSKTVTTDWEARAERAGTLKDGRTYSLHAVGTSDGDDCEGTALMHVPHDMSPKNR